MPDREKVIAMLERYVRIPNLAGAENYGTKIVNMPAPLITDALALLKAQEPVKPIMRHVVFEHDTSSGWENKMYCPKCKMELLTRVNYCPKCGRAVKWND